MDRNVVIVDVRSASVFRQGHMKGACSFVGVDGDDGLLSRLAELPEPRLRANLTVILVRTDVCSTNNRAEDTLRSAGFADVQMYDMQPCDEVVVGNESRRLWAPSVLVQRAVHYCTNGNLALDIGCGGGRDSAWLAAHGWHVHAVDRCTKLLHRARLLATRQYDDNDCKNRGSSVDTELRTFGVNNKDDEAWLRSNPVHLVLVVRFLRRPLLHMLGAAVLPGGVLAYEHFLDGCEAFGAPKKKSQMLRHRELAGLFASHSGFDIVLDEVANLPDGRPVNRFVARKRI